MSGQSQLHPVYRAYVTSPLGHILNSVHLDCETDEQAIEEARRLVGEYSVQLWDRDRKIAFFPALTSTVPASRPRSMVHELGHSHRLCQDERTSKEDSL